MGIKSFPAKRVSAVLDYAFDWSAWLADSETIVTHAVMVTGDVVVDSNSEAGGVVIAWLSGGSESTQSVNCTITTSAGRTDSRSARLQVIAD